MKLGFICLNEHSHLNPMTALARQLQARNHKAIFLCSSEAPGLPVFPHAQNAAEQDTTHKAIAQPALKLLQDWPATFLPVLSGRCLALASDLVDAWQSIVRIKEEV